MNKIGFLVSCLLALGGVNLIIFCVAAQELYPKVGYLVYQSHSPANYNADDYQMDLTWLYALALSCILVGVNVARHFYHMATADERTTLRGVPDNGGR